MSELDRDLQNLVVELVNAIERGIKDTQHEPRTVRRWVNIYKGPHGSYFSRNLWGSEARAKAAANDSEVIHSYIATVPVEWEE